MTSYYINNNYNVTCILLNNSSYIDKAVYIGKSL